jgi:hypothetical protein
MSPQLESRESGSTTTPQPTEGAEGVDSEPTLVPRVEEAHVQSNESDSVHAEPKRTSNYSAMNILSFLTLIPRTPPTGRSPVTLLNLLHLNASKSSTSSRNPNFLMETFQVLSLDVFQPLGQNTHSSPVTLLKLLHSNVAASCSNCLPYVSSCSCKAVTG